MKRTKFAVCKHLFEILFLADPTLSVTELASRSGLNAVSLADWIALIQFIQNQPKLIVHTIGRTHQIALEREPVPPPSPEEVSRGYDLLQKLISMPPSELRIRINALKNSINNRSNPPPKISNL